MSKRLDKRIYPDGWEGKETYLENQLLNRGITIEQYETKMENLHKLMISGYRIMKALKHDLYWVKGKDDYYNPYEDRWIKKEQASDNG